MVLADLVKAYGTLKSHGDEVDSLAFRREDTDLRHQRNSNNRDDGGQKVEAQNRVGNTSSVLFNRDGQLMIKRL